MNLSELRPGMYLVGNDAGTVEPYFVRVEWHQGLVTILHGDEICDWCVLQAVASDGWWWRKMEAECLPQTWDQYPESIKEAGRDD